MTRMTVKEAAQRCLLEAPTQISPSSGDSPVTAVLVVWGRGDQQVRAMVLPDDGDDVNALARAFADPLACLALAQRRSPQVPEGT